MRKPLELGGGMQVAPKILYTLVDTAHLLSLCKESVLELVRAGHLHAVRKGRRLMFNREELERFAKEDTPTIWLPLQNGKTVRRHVERVA